MTIEYRPRCNHVVVAARGRSGTHWLVGTLDLSPATHCRYEHDRPYGRFLESWPSALGAVSERDALGKLYDANMRAARRRVGVLDRAPDVLKQFALRPRRYRRVRRLLERSRVRVAAGMFVPGLRGTSCELPDWLTGGVDWDRALPVVKLHQVIRGAPWICQHRPDTVILHIVRHPCGFLNSWEERWLKHHDPAGVIEAGRRRLHAIAEEAPEWADVFRDIDAMPLQETELWYWRVFNEVMYRAGAGSPSYRLVPFEHFAERPHAVAETIFGACGLDWTESVRERVVADTQRSVEIAGRWRKRLEPWKIELAHRVLEGSCMQRWWSKENVA